MLFFVNIENQIILLKAGAGLLLTHASLTTASRRFLGSYRPVVELYLFLVINGHKYMFPSYFQLKVSLYWEIIIKSTTCNRNSVTKVL